MTREEAIETFKKDIDQREKRKVNETLDKIRAEIEEVQTHDGIYIDRAYVLKIIDKYKTESEK